MKRFLTKALVIIVIIISIFINFKEYLIRPEVIIENNMAGYKLSGLQVYDLDGNILDEDNLIDSEKFNVLVLWETSNIYTFFMLRDFDEYIMENYNGKVNLLAAVVDENVFIAKQLIGEVNKYYDLEQSQNYNKEFSAVNFIADESFKTNIVDNFKHLPMILFFDSEGKLMKEYIYVSNTNSDDYIDSFDEIIDAYMEVK